MCKYLIFAGLIAVSACHKTSVETPPPVVPAMDYSNFNDTTVAYGKYFSGDLDNNGIKDFAFYTQLVGDPLLQRDYREYRLAVAFQTSLAVDSNEHTPVLAKNAVISDSPPTGHSWYNASDIVLARKVIGTSGAPLWEGGWKNVSHQYIAIQVNRNNLMYYGWLEVSFDTAAEKLTLHRGAVCKDAGKEIKAGW